MLKIKKTIEGMNAHSTLKGAIQEYTELEGIAIDRWIKQGDYSPMRIRWDIARAAMSVINQERLCQFICDNLYPLDLNDTHIDNALKSIFNELELPYGI
jgi:hypothetical protein